jgi:glycosyltransferase involved in cell wall biosynthesis
MANPTIDFTVIIPTCFRSIEAVEKCLRSLNTQTLDKNRFEVILVEDGSDQKHKARVEALMSEFFPYHRYLWQKSSGQGVARNLAMEHCLGRLILFLNDDAIAIPTLLDDHIKVHQENPQEAVAVLGKFTVSPELPYSMFARLHSEHAYGIFEGQAEIGWRGFYTCNISVKKSFLDKYGKFDAQLRYYEDVELGERLSHQGLRILYRPQILAYHYHFLDENNFLGYGPFHAKALVEWYKKTPHLKKELAMYGFYPAEPVSRRVRYFFDELIVNRFTIPFWKKVARALAAKHERLALSIYKRIFLSLSRKTIREVLYAK